MGIGLTDTLSGHHFRPALREYGFHRWGTLSHPVIRSDASITQSKTNALPLHPVEQSTQGIDYIPSTMGRLCSGRIATVHAPLCTDSNQNYIQIAETSAGIIHKRWIVNEHRVGDEVFHIQALNNYVSRWRGWMQKFRGVGTDYLKNYLAWSRVMAQGPNAAHTWLMGGVKRLTNI